MSHNYEHRTYMIFNVSELSTINFTQVLEDSLETVRKSVDGSKTLVKWAGDTMPSSVEALTTSEGPYNNAEIFAIMNTTEWSVYDDM